MAEFTYQAVDSEGTDMSGSMFADSEQQLEDRLHQLGYWVIDVREKKTGGTASVKSVPRKELIDFFHGLNALLEAGMTVSDSIAAIAEETDHAGFSAVLKNIQINIEAGNSLDATLTQYPQIFTEQVVNLLKAGDFSGNLPQACIDVSRHLEWVDKIRADVKQASIYPLMVISAVFGLVFLMFTFVVPRFSKIFASLNLELPLLTKGVVYIGDLFTQYWLLILLFPVSIVVLMKYGLRASPLMAYRIDQLKLRLPVFGPLNRMIVQARFCHNMALLTRAGVTILDALSLSRGVVSNRVMEKAVMDAEQAVNEGRRMTEAFRQHAVISPVVLRMMIVGEESGRLENALRYASERFDNEIPRQIKRVFSVLEPVIMLVLISIVGLIGGAVFLPLFSLMSGLGG